MIPRGGRMSQTFYLFILSMLYVKQHPCSQEFPKYAPLRTFSRWALLLGTPHFSSITLHFMLGNYSPGQEHYQKAVPCSTLASRGLPFGPVVEHKSPRHRREEPVQVQGLGLVKSWVGQGGGGISSQEMEFAMTCPPIMAKPRTK